MHMSVEHDKKVRSFPYTQALFVQLEGLRSTKSWTTVRLSHGVLCGTIWLRSNPHRLQRCASTKLAFVPFPVTGNFSIINSLSAGLVEYFPSNPPFYRIFSKMSVQGRFRSCLILLNRQVLKAIQPPVRIADYMEVESIWSSEWQSDSHAYRSPIIHKIKNPLNFWLRGLHITISEPY